MTDDEIAIKILTLDEGENYDVWKKHWKKQWYRMKEELDHSGDCTKQPWTCTVCLVEDIKERIPYYREYFNIK